MDEQQVAAISASSITESQAESGLSNVKDMEAFINDLIEKQCALIGAVAGVIMLRPTRDHPTGCNARYLANPSQPLNPKQYKRLAEIGTQVTKQDQPMTDILTASEGLLSHRPEYRVLASPLRLMGRPHGATVCLLNENADPNLVDKLKKLELSCIMLESFLWRQQAYSEAQSKIQMRETLDLLDKAQQGHNTTEMASLFAHELQRRFGCTRVSIGLVQGHAVRLVALSGTQDVDRKSELAEALEAVMEECADQDIEIRSPQPENIDPSERRVVRAHTSLSERYGPVAIASFPLRIDGGLIGVVVLERDIDDPFNDSTLRLLRLIAEYLGPSVWTRRMADRGILAVSRDRTIELAQITVGPEKTGAKLIAIIVLLVLLFITLFPVADRVNCTARINAEQRRKISAPFTGRIETVLVKPGDEVQQNQPLIKLDTAQLEFKLAQKQNELNKLITEADDKRSQGEIAAADMSDAQIEVVQYDVNLLNYQLQQATIKAPISGTITQGRLEDMEGEVVEPDSPLLEISQLNTLIAQLRVPESGIARVAPGQIGWLALTSRPSDKIEFKVINITPASELFERKNVYRVEIQLIDKPEWLRPGMEGQARIFGKKTNLFNIYARPMLDAVRLKFWW